MSRPARPSDTAELLRRDGSLPARWLRHWGEDPSQPQLCDSGGRWLTRSELEERTRQAAGRLLETGLHAGERLLIVAESSAQFVLAYLAAGALARRSRVNSNSV